MTDLDNWDITTGVGITALGVAAARAVETGRDDALVADPYAAHFVSSAAAPIPLPVTPGDLDQLPEGDSLRGVWTTMSEYLGIRSRYFDDYLREATGAGVRQVVVLAAGLDVRAHRLPWPPGVTLFEVDRPRVLEFKAGVLAEQGATAGCDRRTVAADLRDDWVPELLDAGYDQNAATAWLAEGLLPYLTGDAVDRLFARMHEVSAPGSRTAVEDAGPQAKDLFDQPMFRVAQERLGIDIAALWPDGDRTDAASWLTEHGWQVTASGGQQVAERYGRTLAGFATEGFAGGTLLTARRS